jgi:effector-binding domain-containing protein
MLRHYDEIGLLRPRKVDPNTGYRSYEVGQLGELHRLLALRDLGLTLEQIRPLLADDPSVEQLRGMLRLRQAQIAQDVADEQARLRRVEAHLRALEGSQSMPANDVVVKQTQPLRIAEAAATAPGFGPSLGGVFAHLYPKVIGHLTSAGASPGLCVAWYEEPNDDGSVVVHAGFDIGDQAAPDSDEVRVVELPVIDVASVVHHGPMEGVEPVYEDLVRWIDDSGYRLAGRSRELYHEWHDDDPSRNVTELQMPVCS